MSTCLQHLKDIDRNTKYVVSGYIREEHKLIKQSPYVLFQNIPNAISAFCTLYYHLTDYFDCIGDDVLSSNNRKTLMSTRPCMKVCLQGSTSYGNMVIPSKSNCIYKWQIAFPKYITQRDRFNIGIASTSITTMKEPFYEAKSGKFYCFNPYHGTGFSDMHVTKMWCKYSKRKTHKWCQMRNAWRDKIDFELDLKRKKITIYQYYESEIRGKNVLFHNIEVRDKLDYRLAIVLSGDDFAISIVKFQQIF